MLGSTESMSGEEKVPVKRVSWFWEQCIGFKLCIGYKSSKPDDAQRNG